MVKSNKISRYDVFIILLGLYMISNMLYKLFPEIVSPNRIVGVAIIITIGNIYLKCFQRSDLLIILYLFFISIYTQIISVDYFLNFEHIQYFVTTVLILWKIRNRKIREQLYLAVIRNRKFLFFIIYSIAISIGIGFTFSSNYSYGYTGFSSGAHPFLSGITFVLSTYTLLICNNKFRIREFVIISLLLTSVFMGSARSYLIPIGLLCIIIYYTKFSMKYMRYIVIVFSVAVLVYIIPSTTIAERFTTSTEQAAYSGQSSVEAFSSGRLVFWGMDLFAFSKLEISEKIFGAGFDYLYHYNAVNYGANIWAHNDFIHILSSIGIIGFCFYSGLLVVLLNDFRLEMKRKNGRIKFAFPIIVGYILIVAFINGLYIYQHFLYSIIMLLLLYTQEGNEYTLKLQKVS